MEKGLVLDLLGKAHKAAKVAAGKTGRCPEEDMCLDALNRLKQFLPITREVIVATQILKRLLPLNHNSNKRIQALSCYVFETINRGLVAETSQKRKSGDRSIVKVGEGETKDESKNEKSSMSESKKHEITTKPAPVRVGGPRRISMLLQNPKDKSSRDIVRERLVESLSKVGDEVDDQNQTLKNAVGECDPSNVAALVESELFKNWGSYEGPKKLKYRSVMFNMKEDKNHDFRRKVLLGVFQPDEICKLTTEDMASDARRLEYQKIRQKKLFK